MSQRRLRLACLCLLLALAGCGEDEGERQPATGLKAQVNQAYVAVFLGFDRLLGRMDAPDAKPREQAPFIPEPPSPFGTADAPGEVPQLPAPRLGGALGARNYDELTFWMAQNARSSLAYASPSSPLLVHTGGLPGGADAAESSYRRAAAGGSRDACLALGNMYAQGAGVARNAAQAFAWYLKGAELGDAQMQRLVAGMYAEGEGVKRDPVQGLRWALLSARQGDAQAANLVAGAEARLTPAQRQEAHAQADGLRPKGE